MEKVIGSKRDWEAENDAHTMMECEKIMKDPKRKEKAMKAMKKMMEEKKEDMDMMKNMMDM